MTREEAIRHFESQAQCGYAPTREAAQMAIAVLRARQEPLDRSRWEGCECCKGDLEGYTTCFRDLNGRSKNMYIPEGEAVIVVPGKYNHKTYIKIAYCPHCGRPLTEEAWAELEWRIGGNEQ